MNDNNWQKIIRIGMNHISTHCIPQLIMSLAGTISTKWTRAQIGVQETGDLYRELTDCLDTNWIEEWTRQEMIVMRDRGDALKIFEVAAKKGKT